MAKVPEQVVRRAWQHMRGGMTPAQAISRALAEHGHRYGHPADYARTVLEMAAVLNVYAEHPTVELGPPPTAAAAPLPITWELTPPPGQAGRDVAPAIARVLQRPTSTAGRSSSGGAGHRCTDPACRHGRGTHLRRGLYGQVSEPCTWGNCPCEDYRTSGQLQTGPKGGRVLSARIVRVGRAPTPAPSQDHPPVASSTRVPPQVERPPVTIIRYSLDSAPRAHV